MGNCLSGLAFKEEEPVYEIRRPKTRENIQKRTSSYNTTGHNRRRDSFFDEVVLSSYEFGALDDIFEPLPVDVDTKEYESTTSKSVEVSVCVGPIASERVEVAAKEGILKVMSELERELSRRKGWLNQPRISKKVEETKASEQEQVNLSPQVPTAPEECTDPNIDEILSGMTESERELNLHWDLNNQSKFDEKAEKAKEEQEKSSPEVSKNPAQKHQASPEDFAEIIKDEAPKIVKLNRKVSFKLDLPPAQEADKKTISPRVEIHLPNNRSTSYKLVKPHNISKNIANKYKRKRNANIKKQNNCAPVKVKKD
jgi:hypothetical protein